MTESVSRVKKGNKFYFILLSCYVISTMVETTLYTVKATTVPDAYVLTGKSNEKNNFDDFSWWIAKQFGELPGLWITTTDPTTGTVKSGPTDRLTPMMLLRNMDVTLHSQYRDHPTGMEMWNTLVKHYTGDSSTSRALLLSSVAVYRPTVDMDEALGQCPTNDFCLGESNSHQTSCGDLVCSKPALRV